MSNNLYVDLGRVFATNQTVKMLLVTLSCINSNLCVSTCGFVNHMLLGFRVRPVESTPNDTSVALVALYTFVLMFFLSQGSLQSWDVRLTVLHPIALFSEDLKATECILWGDIRSAFEWRFPASRKSLKQSSQGRLECRPLTSPEVNPQTHFTQVLKGSEMGSRMCSALNSKCLREDSQCPIEL